MILWCQFAGLGRPWGWPSRRPGRRRPPAPAARRAWPLPFGLIVTTTTQGPGAPIVDGCRTTEQERDGSHVEGGWSAGGVVICPFRRRERDGRALVIARRGRPVPLLPGERHVLWWLFAPKPW